jgi:hypothetical protein
MVILSKPSAWPRHRHERGRSENMSRRTWWKPACEWIPATTVPVVEEKVRWQTVHRSRWTPLRAEPQRIVLSCPQCGQAPGPSRRISIAPSACIRISRDFSAARSSFSCGPLNAVNEPQSFLNSLTSMIAPNPRAASRATHPTIGTYQEQHDLQTCIRVLGRINGLQRNTGIRLFRSDPFAL